MSCEGEKEGKEKKILIKRKGERIGQEKRKEKENVIRV
jgi:hypothetical protein